MDTSFCYSPLHEGRPVVIVVGGWSNDGVLDSNGINKSADRTEMLDYTQTNSTWVEGNKKQNPNLWNRFEIQIDKDLINFGF